MRGVTEQEIFETLPVHKAVATLAHFFRSEGHAKLASAGIMLGGILNMILDSIFIYGLKMGFTGAAVATALSNLVSMMFFLFRFQILKDRTALSLSLWDLLSVLWVLPHGFCRQWEKDSKRQC